MRGRLQEVSDLSTNQVPAQCDVAPESPYNQERLRALSTGVCTGAVATHEYESHTELSILLEQRLEIRPCEFFRAEMLCLSGLSVALALALVPGSSEALREGECEGRSAC